ncbi:MAG: ribonuclease H family protein [Peptococcaceae bacterium]|nr:ribonuclease H family protein [Peptococcaceae bacterium]
MAQKFYAVKQGRKTGLFTTWDDCKAQVQGYSGAVYKSFPTLAEAQAYLWGTGGTAGNTGNQAEQKQEETLNLNALPADEMVAYVDGSFHLEKRMFAYGAVIFYNGKEYRFAGSDADAELAEMRNVAGEIRGAEKAMAFALEEGAKVLHIYHDYEGIARWCTGEWQAKKTGTQQYREFYRKAVAAGLSVIFHKVKGHSGDKYNDLADKLAKEALGIK